jgi:hypothetical protein
MRTVRTVKTPTLGATWLAVAVVVVGTACSSSSKAGLPATTARPGSTSSSVASACATGGSASGGQGGGDVLVPGDIPDNQVYVAYQSPTDGYRLSVPEGWARTASTGEVTFRDKLNSIRLQLRSATSAPSVSSAQASDVAALAVSTPCFEAGQVSAVTRTAGAAVLITYRAHSPADPVTGKVVQLDVERYEFWRAGKLAVITLSSPRGSDNVDPWRKVTDSFSWGP